MRGMLFLKNSIVARNPPAKSETGLKPAPRVLSTSATECFTSPSRSAPYLIVELDLARLRIVRARSVIVILLPPKRRRRPRLHAILT